MAIEEIRYDFREHPEKFHSYFAKIMRLIIISKLNCLEKNLTSLKYFNELISRIEGCETHKIKYGKSMIFTKFFGYEFNYHTVRVKIKITEKYTIDISLESIIPDFVKTFDKLSTDTNEINWNITKYSINGIKFDDQKRNSQDESNLQLMEKEAKLTFYLLDSFIQTLYLLMTQSGVNTNSLSGRIIEIKDISVSRKILNIEMLVDEKTVILDCLPKSKNGVVVSIDNDEKIGETIRAVMLQNNYN
ncbi:MAG TPA: hypothetical protein VJL78_06900 [Candidatus Nitrosocosmicus sp.]|nr:hypothetical protein [Candidatus Nitrosocosmicus sp.]